MFNDINEFKNGEIFESDICVVGGGAAGIDIARFFNGKNKSVLLIESGNLSFDPETQKLYEIKCIGKGIRNGGYDFNSHLKSEFKNESRIRQFGGTTNIWSGKWKILDPIDLKQRDWIPNSGWPISYNDLLHYYKEIGREYELLDIYSYCNEKWKTEITNSLFSKLKDIKYTIHYEEKLPLNFKFKFGRELEECKNVHVLLNANAFSLILNDSHTAIKKLTVKTLNGKEYSIISRNFILACGGLENARLLLASNKQIASGIGNSKGLVGRFYMDHPKGKLGIVIPSTTTPFPKDFYQGVREDKIYKIGFSLTETKQVELQTLNHNLYLKPVLNRNINLDTHVIKRISNALATRTYRKLIKTVMELLVDTRNAFETFISRLLRKPLPEISHYEIIHYLEQSPNYESRLFLNEELDSIGMRKITIDWKFSELERESFKYFVQHIKQVFLDSNLGEIIIDNGFDNLNFLVDASHHMGTTRMAASSDDGVVDSNCKVFGIENLYIAGSSIFPTGGNANPTYTILALSRRLCHHLEKSVFTTTDLEESSL